MRVISKFLQQTPTERYFGVLTFAKLSMQMSLQDEKSSAPMFHERVFDIHAM